MLKSIIIKELSDNKVYKFYTALLLREETKMTQSRGKKNKQNATLFLDNSLATIFK